jgi:hypothetical protein
MGVVIGPLSATLFLRTDSRTFSGSGVPAVSMMSYAGLDDVPVERRSVGGDRRLQDAPGGLDQLRAGAVAPDQGHVMYCHAVQSPCGRVRMG